MPQACNEISIEGNIDGHEASVRCKQLKRVSFSSELGESPKKTSNGPAVNRKLTYSQASDIRARYSDGGITMTQLANEYGVTKHVISRLLNGITYNVKPAFSYVNNYANA